MPINVLIADDHPVVRLGLTAMLNGREGINVVGDVKDIDSLLLRLQAGLPDLLILDLDLEPGGEDNMSALRTIRNLSRHIRIIVYTAHDDESLIVDALALGVEGYILKRADPSELIKAIHVVHQGGSLLHADVAAKLMHHMRGGAASEKRVESKISRREMDVLHLMAEGKSNQQIAAGLVISERTVKFHVSSILGKLEVENRTAAVLKATRSGIIPTPGD